VAELDRIVLATSNAGKLRDFQFLFADTGIVLEAPGAYGVEMDVEETGTTFEANALLKARAIHVATGRPTLADDSGLAVDALGGAPGVLSARYAGEPSDDRANNRKLIAALDGIADRSAAFVCALALVLPDGSEIVAHGRCTGTIVDEERGENGFGYDSVFYRADLGCTFGQASPAEKNERSHRAAAVRSLLAEIRRRGLLA